MENSQTTNDQVTQPVPATPVSAPVAPATSAIAGDASKNGSATASLVLGIIGMIFWIVPFVGVPVNIIGVVMGNKGRASQKRATANWGMWLSIIGLVASLINAALGVMLATK